MEKPSRLLYVDWLRGLAALGMLFGHAFHSWVREDLRGTHLYQLSQMIGGVPAPLFLLLTGISLVILLERCERRGESAWGVFLRRSAYILGVAFVFRIQQWLFYWPHSPAAGILKVDVLNTIGVGLLVAGGTMLLAPQPIRRASAAIGAVAVAVLTPLVWAIPEAAGPGFLLDHLRGGAETASFPMFPWISYTFTGVLVGLLIVGRKDRYEVDRAMQWLVLVALCLIAGARFFDTLPYTYYQPYNYWLTSPNLVANRTAVALLLLAGAYGWSRLAAPARFSWLRQLGQTSLLVYWVHLELVYGRSGYWLQGKLDLRQTMAGTVALAAMMLLVSLAKTRWWTGENLARLRGAVAGRDLGRYAEGSSRETADCLVLCRGADREGSAG